LTLLGERPERRPGRSLCVELQDEYTHVAQVVVDVRTTRTIRTTDDELITRLG